MNRFFSSLLLDKLCDFFEKQEIHFAFSGILIFVTPIIRCFREGLLCKR